MYGSIQPIRLTRLTYCSVVKNEVEQMKCELLLFSNKITGCMRFIPTPLCEKKEEGIQYTVCLRKIHLIRIMIIVPKNNI